MVCYTISFFSFLLKKIIFIARGFIKRQRGIDYSTFSENPFIDNNMVFQRSNRRVATSEFKVFHLFSLPSFQADNIMAFLFSQLIIIAANPLEKGIVLILLKVPLYYLTHIL